MKSYFLLVPALFLFASCQNLKNESAQAEISKVAIFQLQSRVDDIQHHLSASKAELEIMDAKLEGQEKSLTQRYSKKEKEQQGKVEALEKQLKEMMGKLAHLEKKEEESRKNWQTLYKNAEESRLAFSEYKNKLNDLEEAIFVQNMKFNEIQNIKSAVAEMANILKQEDSKQYVVKSGDSLEKIAKNYGCSVDDLKKSNALEKDLIFAGQKLILP